MPKPYQIGDLFVIPDAGAAGEIECIVMEVSPEDGRATKLKAVHKEDWMLKKGWYEENGEYVIFEYQITQN